MEHLWILLVVFIFDNAVGKPNPCTTHQNISDTVFQTNSACFPQSPAPAWYRFTGNSAGSMATQCPTASDCGGAGHVWIKGLLPMYNDGITDVIICISQGSKCCVQQNKLRAKNCNSFFVFELRRLPNCNVQYCFNKTDVTLVTISTTPSTTPSMTLSTTSSTTTRSATSLTTPSTTSMTPFTTSPTATLPTISSTKTPSTTPLSTTPLARITSLILNTSKRANQPTVTKTTFSKVFDISKVVPNATTFYGALSTGHSSTLTISSELRNETIKKEPNLSSITTVIAVCTSIGAFILICIIFVLVFRVYRTLRLRTDKSNT